jgi:hypothetical protein
MTEMTDNEVHRQVQRAEHFIEQLHAAITATAVDLSSPCADATRRGLQRIGETLDQVPFVTMCNLSNLDAALRGGLMDLIEVRLMCVGAGPTMDYADAVEFLAVFDPLIEKARKRMLQ